MGHTELEAIKARMEQLSLDDLHAIVKFAGMIENNRIVQRKKELWGNIIAAIKKYEGEVDIIGLVNEDSEWTFGILPLQSEEKPGTLYIYED